MEDTITENIKGFKIKLKSIPGAFSKKGVDEGSRLLINTINISNGTLIADLGCGSGVIGIIAAKMNPKGHVHLLDVNIRMVELAKTNIKINKVENAEVFISDLFSAVGNRTYHQIFSNPSLHIGKEFLNETASECYKHLKPSCSVLLVIQAHLKPFVQRVLSEHFGNSKIVARGKKHVVIQAARLN